MRCMPNACYASPRASLTHGTKASRLHIHYRVCVQQAASQFGGFRFAPLCTKFLVQKDFRSWRHVAQRRFPSWTSAVRIRPHAVVFMFGRRTHRTSIVVGAPWRHFPPSTYQRSLVGSLTTGPMAAPPDRGAHVCVDAGHLAGCPPVSLTAARQPKS